MAIGAPPPFILRCFACAREVSPEAAQPRCECGHRVLVVEPDLEAAARTLTHESLASRPATLRRYRELLPFLESDPPMTPLMTPLVPGPELARDRGLGSLWIKDEGCQPSGSLKARPSAIAAARAAALGFEQIATASSGNAAISLAAMAASRGQVATVFVPERIPAQKLAQLQVFGARVVLVAGPYESAYALCDRACDAWGWYNRNCAQDPYLVEGKKTCGLEIAEQSADEPPDWVAVPVGDGCTIAGIWKGLSEMAALGIAPRAPRMLAVQASGAATVHDAWSEGAPIDAVEDRYAAADTIADSIAVTHPHNGERAVDAIRSSGGAAVTVSDDALRGSVLRLSRSGVFVEPASAATLAGVDVARERGIIESGATVVVVGTGTGLKSFEQISGLLPEAPAPIEPTLDALAGRLGL